MNIIRSKWKGEGVECGRDPLAQMVKDVPSHLSMIARNLIEIENMQWLTEVTTFVAVEDAFHYRLGLVFHEIVLPLFKVCCSGSNSLTIDMEGVCMQLKLSAKEKQSKLFLLFGRIQTLFSTQRVVLRRMREMICKTTLSKMQFKTIFTDLSLLFQCYRRYTEIYQQCNVILDNAIAKSHKCSLANINKSIVANESITLDQYFAYTASSHEALCDYSLWKSIFRECSGKIEYLETTLSTLAKFRQNYTLNASQVFHPKETSRPIVFTSSELSRVDSSFECSVVCFDLLNEIPSEELDAVIECKKAHFRLQPSSKSGLEESSFSQFSLHEMEILDLNKFSHESNLKWVASQQFNSSFTILFKNSISLVYITFFDLAEKKQFLEQVCFNLMPWEIVSFQNATLLTKECFLCQTEFKLRKKRKVCTSCREVACKMCCQKSGDVRICTECLGDSSTPGLVLDESKEAGSATSYDSCFPTFEQCNLQDVLRFYQSDLKYCFKDGARLRSPRQTLLVSEAQYVNRLSILFHAFSKDLLDFYTGPKTKLDIDPSIYNLYLLIESLYLAHKNFLTRLGKNSFCTQLLWDFSTIIWPIYIDYIQLYPVAVSKLKEFHQSAVFGNMMFLKFKGLDLEYLQQLVHEPLLRMQHYEVIFSEFAASMIKDSAVSSDVQAELKLVWKLVSHFKTFVLPECKRVFPLACFDSMLFLPRNCQFTALSRSREFLGSFPVEFENEKHQISDCVLHLFNDHLVRTCSIQPNGKMGLIDYFRLAEIDLEFHHQTLLIKAKDCDKEEMFLKVQFKSMDSLQELSDRLHSCASNE